MVTLASDVLLCFISHYFFFILAICCFVLLVTNKTKQHITFSHPYAHALPWIKLSKNPRHWTPPTRSLIKSISMSRTCFLCSIPCRGAPGALCATPACYSNGVLTGKSFWPKEKKTVGGKDIKTSKTTYKSTTDFGLRLFEQCTNNTPGWHKQCCHQ